MSNLNELMPMFFKEMTKNSIWSDVDYRKIDIIGLNNKSKVFNNNYLRVKLKSEFVDTAYLC